jgi:hypothetical protein
MTNLLKETIEKLKEYDKTPEDVAWVGTISGTSQCTWEAFTRMANQDYDSGFGGQEVRDPLVIVGKNWWLERHEYDGSEWWEFKQTPKLQKNPKDLLWLFYDDVDEIRWDVGFSDE